MKSVIANEKQHANHPFFLVSFLEHPVLSFNEQLQTLEVNFAIGYPLKPKLVFQRGFLVVSEPKLGDTQIFIHWKY